MGKSIWLMTCAVGALAAGHARAATANTNASTTATVSDIVVTAEKREATVQTVPIAISAFTSKERDLVGIDTINDLQNFTPGLRYSASLDRIFLRGIGRQTNNLATDPGVATYIDGVYDAATYDAGGDELFISRTEVLRGPQGTLYGRNSIGGAINVISVEPTDHFYAEGRASVGNYGRYTIEGVTSGPINDNLRFRVGGEWIDQDKGYFSNVAIPGQTEDGNERNWYFEGQLAANVGKLDLWAKATVDGYSGTYRGTNSVSPYDTEEFSPGTLGPNFGYAYNPLFMGTFTQVGTTKFNPGVFNQWLYNTVTPSLIKINPDFGFTWRATYHADGFDVKYLGGWAHHFLEINSGFGNTPITSVTYALTTTPQPALGGFFGSACALHNFLGTPCGPLTLTGPVTNTYVENKTWMSHELDFISSAPGPFQWLGGLYYYHESYDQPDTFNEPNQPQLATPLMAFTGPAVFTAPVFAAPNPTLAILSTDERMHGDSYAGFGQIDWKFTPAWKLTVGLRYTYDDKGGVERIRELCVSCDNFFHSFFTGPGFGPGGLSPQNLGTLTPVWDVTSLFIPDHTAQPGSGPVVGPDAQGFFSRDLSGHWSGFTGTAGLEWSPTPDLLAYAKYSRGYKAGGFNAGSLVPTPEVGPETLDDFEGGVKKTFAERLTVDAAVFYYIYDNMQIELGQNFAGTTKFFLQGVPEVHNYGFELESTWRPTDDLMFLLSYAYLNTDITKSGCYLDSVSTQPSSPGCVVKGDPATDIGLFNVKGNQLIDSPPNKVAINANYTWHFDPGQLTLSVSNTWTDYHYSSLFNGPNYFSPGYNNLDLRLLWNDAKDRYTVILFAKNALNQVQYDYIFPGTSLGPNGLPLSITHALNAPALYGVQVQVRWK